MSNILLYKTHSKFKCKQRGTILNSSVSLQSRTQDFEDPAGKYFDIWFVVLTLFFIISFDFFLQTGSASPRH